MQLHVQRNHPDNNPFAALQVTEKLRVRFQDGAVAEFVGAAESQAIVAAEFLGYVLQEYHDCSFYPGKAPAGWLVADDGRQLTSPTSCRPGRAAGFLSQRVPGTHAAGPQREAANWHCAGRRGRTAALPLGLLPGWFALLLLWPLDSMPLFTRHALSNICRGIDGIASAERPGQRVPGPGSHRLWPLLLVCGRNWPVAARIRCVQGREYCSLMCKDIR